MKRVFKLVLVTLVLCIVILVGCSSNSSAEETNIANQFVPLEKWDYNTGLCYDKDTKIIYIYIYFKNGSGWGYYTYSPYYVMDENNEPTIAVYYD